MITSSFKRDVKLEVWALNGEKIITLFDDELYPGYHAFKWNGKNSMGKRGHLHLFLLNNLEKMK